MRRELRDGERGENGRPLLPERLGGALLARAVEVLQVGPVAGREVRQPSVEVVHAHLVEEGEPVARGVPLVGIHLHQVRRGVRSRRLPPERPEVARQAPLDGVTE